MTMLGKKQSIETKRKISHAHQGKKKPWAGKYIHKSLTEEHKKNIGKANTGRVFSEETKDKISKSLMGHPGIKGDKNNMWKGGISFEPYSVDWTKTLKRSIRERDTYICQICQKPQEDVAHDVHHIDYNKNNCNPENLITLCKVCHSRTNHNRHYWLKYFEKFWPVPGWNEEDLKKLN